MIYINVDLSDFRDAFRLYKRDKEFSYEGLSVLYEFLEEYSQGDDIELDVVAICLDYSEYKVKDLIDDYDYLLEGEEFEGEDDILEALLEKLQYHTLVLEVGRGDSYIIQNF